MTHKPKKVGQTFMYKEGIYDYRGAKLWCETKKVKILTAHGDIICTSTLTAKRCVSGVRQTPEYLTWEIDRICEEYGTNECAKGFKVYDDEVLGEV